MAKNHFQFLEPMNGIDDNGGQGANVFRETSTWTSQRSKRGRISTGGKSFEGLEGMKEDKSLSLDDKLAVMY